MKNPNLVKAIIIILAVVCLLLALQYAKVTIGADPDAEADTGSYETSIDGTEQNPGQNGSDGAGNADNSYTVSDDGTLEMDSIPNGVDSPAASDSDA